MTNPNLVQVEFRARNDDVALNSATFTHALNANFSQAVDTPFRVRFTIAETVGGMANNIAYSLQYNLAGAGFVAIGDTAAVKSALSSQFANADATTQVISTGAFVAGAGYEQTTTSNISLTSQRTEIEWCLSIDSAQVTNGQTFTLRVVQAAGAVLQTYTQTPTITVVEAVTANTLTGTIAAAGQLPKLPGPSAVAAVNTNATLDADTTYLLRVRVENSGGAGSTSFRWSYDHEASGFVPVTTTSTHIKAVAAASFVDAADVPEVLGGSGTYLTNNDAATEDGTTTLAADFPAGGAVEFVLAFQIDSTQVTDEDTGQIRLELGDGTDLDAYTNTLTYTVNAATGDVTAATTAGTLVLVGQAPTVATSSVAAPTTAALTATGHALTLAGHATREPTTATLAATADAPTIVADAALEPGLNALVITGVAPSVGATVNADSTPEVGVLGLTALAPEIAAGAVLLPNVDTIEIASFAPAIAASATLEPTAADLSFTGETPTVEIAGSFSGTPDSGSVALVGQPPTVVADATCEVETGVVEIAGNAPQMSAHFAAEPTTLTLAIAGQEPTAAASSLMAPSVGALTTSALEPTVSAGAGATAATQPGALSLTGQVPDVSATVVLTPEAGAVAFTGQAPTVSISGDVELFPTPGVLLFTGAVAIVSASAELATIEGEAALVGHSPTESADSTLDAGSVLLAAFGHAPEVAVDVALEPASGALATASDAPDVFGHSTGETVTGILTLTGHDPDVVGTSAGEAVPLTVALQITPICPDVSTGHNIDLAGPTSLVLTGHAPEVTAGQGVSLTTDKADFAVTGYDVTWEETADVVANDVSIGIVGYPPTILVDINILTEPGLISISTYPPFLFHVPPSGRRIVPVSARDRQFAVTGRRRVFRVGPRASPKAA